MTSAWSAPVDATAEAARVALESLPTKMVWAATVHYYRYVHRGAPARVLVVDTWNWQVGRHVYFVPIHFETERGDLIRRHTTDRDGSSSTITELHWSEFERRYPAPSQAVLEIAA